MTTTVHDVHGEVYSVHKKRGADDDAPKTMRIDYLVAFEQYQSEWICPEHTGWARSKAEQWWEKRTDYLLPDTAEEAVRLANEGILRQTRSITVRQGAGEPYPSIVAHTLVPDGEELPVAAFAEDDEIPF